MASNVIAHAKPKRLFCRRGLWYLDIISISWDGGGVFRPRPVRVEGNDAILETLSAMSGSLARRTAELLNGANQEKQTYEAVGNDWMPSTQSGPGERQPALEAEVVQLRRQLVEVRSEFASLHGRVAALEARSHGIEQQNRRAVSIDSDSGWPSQKALLQQPVPAIAEGLSRPEESPEPTGTSGGDPASATPKKSGDDTPGTAEPAKATEGGDPAADPGADKSPADSGAAKASEVSSGGASEANADTSTDSASAEAASTQSTPDGDSRPDSPSTDGDTAAAEGSTDEASPGNAAADSADPEPEQPILVPMSGDACNLVKQLVGEDTEIEPTEKELDISGDHLYSCLVIDDADAVVGLLVGDLEATVRLGAAMMMLPESEVTSQLETKTPSEDSLEAMSEVFNNLSSTINSVEKNPHVRTRSLESLNLDSVPWARKPRQRLDLTIAPGGQIVILSR